LPPGRAWVFVKTLGNPVGIITKADLQKQPVRMLLFWLVTLLEMEMSRVVRLKYPGVTWKDNLSANRVENAQLILDDRRKRNEEIDLLECIQFCDKRDLLLKETIGFKTLGFESKKDAKAGLKDVLTLRNELAHGQVLKIESWSKVVSLTERVIENLSAVE
jgi:hypothetical protein